MGEEEPRDGREDASDTSENERSLVDDEDGGEMMAKEEYMRVVVVAAVDVGMGIGRLTSVG